MFLLDRTMERRTWSGWRRFILLVACAMLGAGCETSLGPLPIVLTITAPKAGDSALAGDTVLLAATVTVAGRLADAAVTWSDAHRVLGTGGSVWTAFSDSGLSEIHASVDLGARGSQDASVPFRVRHNSAPEFSLVAIPQRLYVHDSVPLVGRAADPESTAVRMLWFEDGEPLGEGDAIVWSPGQPQAEHRVTARAIDPQGNSTDSTVVVRALDDGQMLWVVTAPGAPWLGRGGPGGTNAMLASGDNGDLVVGFYGPETYRSLFVYRADGSFRWRAELDNIFWDHSSGLTLSPDGTVFVFDFQGMGYCFSAAGAPVWKRQVLGHDPHGRFALDPAGRLYAAGNAGNLTPTLGKVELVRLDSATGDDVWRATLAGGFGAGPAVLADSSLTVVAAAYLHRFDPGGSAIDDSTAAGGSHYMSAADWRGHTYLTTRLRTLQAVGPGGTLEWEVAFPERPGEPVVAGDSTIYTGATTESGADGTTEVRGIAQDGTVRWTTAVSGGPWISRYAALADGTLYVAAGYYLHRLSRATGAVLTTVEFPSAIESGLAVGPDGTVYLVTGDGRLQAVRGDAPLDPEAPWATWRRDNRRTASVPRP